MEKNMIEELKKEYDSDEVFSKEITQLEKVEPVTRALSDMGAFYKDITTKLLKEDSICYLCKTEIKKDEPAHIIKVPNDKVDKGLIAFTLICDKCQN